MIAGERSHKRTPILGALQDEGFHVALVTDGRMSGASGKIPAAIPVTPECLAGGPLAKVRSGDLILVDARSRHPGGARARPRVENAPGRRRRAFTGIITGSAASSFVRPRSVPQQGAMTFVTPEDAESMPTYSPPPVHDHFVFAEAPVTTR